MNFKQDEHFRSTKYKADDPGPQPGDPGPQPNGKGARVDPRYTKLVTVDEFMARMRPPSYIVDGVIQRGCVYSLTGLTGAGKTAVALLLSSCVAHGEDLGEAWHLGGRWVQQGSVLFLAGENPDNVRIQWYGLRDDLRVEKTPPIYFHDGAFSIEGALGRLFEDATRIPDLALVVADTHQAFFDGDDDNSNTQMCAAARSFRELTNLPGHPTVLIPAHPVKNARRDAMVPRGGSAFMNEVDGNLALWRDDDQAEIYSCGKHRGVPFDPLKFKFVRTEPKGLVDQHGRQMPCTIARPLLRIEAEKAAQETESKEDRALAAIRKTPRISMQALAEILGATHHTAGQRMVEKLKARGWVKDNPKGRGLVLTTQGEGVLDDE